MTKVAGFVARHPSRVLFSWFLGLALVGTLLLSLPASRAPGAAPLGFSDAAFTATSAACVTGLAVRSTAHDFSFVGQLVILVLIQLGGLGITTIATIFFVAVLHWDRPLYVELTEQTLGIRREAELERLVPRILALVLLIEAAAAVVLTLRVWPTMEPLAALWWGVFHAVSAFCNAGFTLQDDSLASYVGDPVVNLTLMALILVGGIGYPVLRNVYRAARAARGHRRATLTFHSKLTLSAGLIILAASIALFWLLERDRILHDLPDGVGWLATTFQAVTMRTAGFNTVALSDLTGATLFIMMVLMLIGANSCSTGGGMKVSTVSVLLLQLIAELRGKAHATLFGRRIARTSVTQAVHIVVAYAATLAAGLSLVLVFQQTGQAQAQSGSFLDAMFEVVSALATVGASTGFTEQLVEPSRWVIVVLMFAGRIGPLVMVAALARPAEPPSSDDPIAEAYVG